MKMRPSVAVLGAAAVVSAIAAASAGAAPLYRVEDLGVFDGMPWAINSSDRIVGLLYQQPGFMPKAVMRDASGIVDIGIPGENVSEAFAINAAGHAVGTSYSSSRAFYYDGTVTRYLFEDEGEGSSRARGINARGQVTGAYTADRFLEPMHAFLLDGQQRLDLGTLGGNMSEGRAVNEQGYVAGWSDRADGSVSAFLFDGTAMRDLGADRPFSEAWAINSHGQVAGATAGPGGFLQAFIHDGTEMIELGTLGGPTSYGLGINDQGYVVGYSMDGSGSAQSRGFLYDGSLMRDLNDLLDESGDGWFIAEASAINAAGRIVGVGYRQGMPRLFVLTPVPEPRIWAFLAVGIGLLGAVVRRRTPRVTSSRRFE